MNPVKTMPETEEVGELEQELEEMEASTDIPVYASEAHAPYHIDEVIGKETHVSKEGFKSRDRREAFREFKKQYGSVDFLTAETSHTQGDVYEALRITGYRGTHIPSENESQQALPEPQQPV